MAKNELYASAEASIIALFARNCLNARTTIPFQSANEKSRRRGSRSFGSRRSGCGVGVRVSSGFSCIPR
jgi:hypothetical protein